MQYTETNKARILIVDDHPIVREGISMLINREAELQVCHEASDINQAMLANKECKHDLAIVDLSLAGLSGLDLLKKLHVDFPDLPVLIMSMHDEAVYAELALKAGARGYLMKQVATSTILHAIRLILSGEIYISDQLRTRLVQKMTGGKSEASPISSLTPTEFEVLHLIGLGLGTGEIAFKMMRSSKTIESHRANIKRKLNLSSASQLTHFAINLVSPIGRAEAKS